MDENKEERKAKWDQPEIEDFPEDRDQSQSADEQRVNESAKHGCGPNSGGCRPSFGGCRPSSGGCRPSSGGCRPSFGGCRPSFGGCFPFSGCFPFGGGICNPRKGCGPFVGSLVVWPYCRPFGFNYGYGCRPRR